MLVLTLMLAGRAMKLAFIHRAGQGEPGDPPPAWLMPLIGDAVIGLSALVVAYLIWKKRGLWVWTSVIVWNVVAIWDALSAFVIQTTNPWPEFFMLQLLGSVMLFAASAMHLILLYLMSRKSVYGYYLQNQQWHPKSYTSFIVVYKHWFLADDNEWRVPTSLFGSLNSEATVKSLDCIDYSDSIWRQKRPLDG